MKKTYVNDMGTLTRCDNHHNQLVPLSISFLSLEVSVSSIQYIFNKKAFGIQILWIER